MYSIEYPILELSVGTDASQRNIDYYNNYVSAQGLSASYSSNFYQLLFSSKLQNLIDSQVNNINIKLDVLHEQLNNSKISLNTLIFKNPSGQFTTGFITEVVMKWFKYFNKIQRIIYMLFIFIISSHLSLFCFLSQNKVQKIRQKIIIRHVQKNYCRILIISEDASLNFILLYVFCNQYQNLVMNRFFQLKIQQQTVSEVSSILVLTQITSTAQFQIYNYLPVFLELYLMLFLIIMIWQQHG
ncbi:Hypothetical_protein [Hexamita inflata]|uniref:Hypothetical_protein n=1 Tax=Hexamita inflata TaxID=28002 RepID=A0ABP1HPJ6_9EUKA